MVIMTETLKKLIIPLFFCMLLTTTYILEAEPATKRIFILNSFNRGYIWTDNMLRGIDNAFAGSGITIETYVTFMDMKRIPPTQEYFSELENLIKTGYKGIRFDAVMVCDNDAFNFMLKYRSELFPEIPLVFVSINDYSDKTLNGQKYITGTSENTDYTGTIKAALKLRTEAKNIVVVVDNTTTGKAHRSAVEKIRSEFGQDINFKYLSLADMTLQELAVKLSALEKDSIVLLLQHFVDRNGTTYTIKQSTPVLANSSSVPVFVISDTRLGLGTLGGRVVSGYYHGEAAAEIVVKILKGADIKSIPVLLNSPNKFMFDYNVMQRFNIDESSLPAGSIVINKPVFLLEKYKGYLLGIITAFFLLCSFIVYLLFEIKKRIKAEKEVNEKNRFIESLINLSPDIIYIYDLVDKKNIYINDGIEKVLGYSAADIDEMGDQLLIKLMYPADLKIYFEETILKYGRVKDLEPVKHEYRMLHKNGGWEWLDASELIFERGIDGSPKRIFGVIHQITERRKSEDKIKSLFEEKEILLKEVHHRIKNNMNTIKGLLSLQIESEENESARDSLADAESRVQSIIMLYDRLYKTDNYRELSIREYLEPLAEDIIGGFSSAVVVNVQMNIEDFILDANLLSPVGIIVNELLTNMMKYAFIGRERGHIMISAFKKEGQVTIIIEDDGIGIPESISFDKSTGFGLQLVNMLTLQIGGKIRIERGNGSKFILECGL